MASNRSALFEYFVIGLLVLNLAATSYAIFRPTEAVSAKSNVDISEAQANKLANEVVSLYNAKDNIGLYARFDSLAKAQLTQESLTAQLNQLYPVLGTVSDAAFSSAVFAGNDNGRDYYHLLYKVRLSGGPFITGDMKLTVTKRENGLGLVGYFINGTSQPGQK